jgi:ribonucleoside-diphosphate reductase alpha chain
VVLVINIIETGTNNLLFGKQLMSNNLYEKTSERRKREQADGLMPDWYTTGGAQMFYDKYEFETEGRSVRGQFERIAMTAAKHLAGTAFAPMAYTKFFELLWKGWLSPSTPVLANMGTNRGMPVSCSGGVIDDSINGFYTNRLETAMLTKNGFGTSSYLGHIRARGSKIAAGGKASGVLPVFKGHVQDMRDVAQGTARRGAWAGYLEIDHGDFDELADHISAEPDDANVGWIIKDSFTAKLDAGDADAIRRFQKAMKLKMVTGKGYFCFIDKINRKRPDMYVKHGLTVKASNLCDEITLFADVDHTYTCVLSSMNVFRFDEWKETDAVYWATIFLDCVAEEFIQRGKNVPGLERAVRFTEKGRALGLGQCGFHTRLQQLMIPFESFDAHMESQTIAAHIHEQSVQASKDMAINLGEPEWCKGFGLRNTHRIAIAPTKSTALLMGGISEGINPDPAMTFTQTTAAGEVDRINPILLELMKKKQAYTKKNIQSITDMQGSVQHVDWLTPEEKEVFKTAFEINQKVVLRLAAARGRYIDQWQSLNLFFGAAESPAWIAEVHSEAFRNPHILGLYYIYTVASNTALTAKNTECEACS